MTIQFPSELCERFVKAKEEGRPIPYFYRVYKNFTPEQQREVRDILNNQGYNLDPPNKGKVNGDRTKSSYAGADRIFWTDQEWDRITDLVWDMRRRNPRFSLVKLANKAVQQLPKDRQRNLASHQLEPLVRRIKERQEKLEEENITAAVPVSPPEEQPSREEILSSLSDEEIFDRYAEKIVSLLTAEDIVHYAQPNDILDNLPMEEIVGYAVMYFYRDFVANARQHINVMVASPEEKPHIITPTATKNGTSIRQKKIALFGLLGRQQEIVQKEVGHLAKLKFHDASRKAELPSGQDVYVLWKRFINHSLFDKIQTFTRRENSRMVLHEQGLKEMIEKIKEMV